MTIIQQPDALSLSYNIRDFKISSSEAVPFVLKKGATVLVSQTYQPGQDGYVVINVRDIIHAQLSFALQNIATAYEQPNIVADFTAVIGTAEITFRAIRAGVDNFADTAANFLTANFLTWQPQEKPVTYSSPEFLTYYAVVASVCKLKAYYTDESGAVTSNETITAATLTAGKAYTIPTQYAAVSALLGSKLPAFYDVWIEDAGGNRLTYVQRYYAGDMLSEQEDWILFENSLGGIDTFRAYGATDFTGDHTHNIAEVDEVSEEYRVDTERKYKKNTGYLNDRERRWLLDFFPSAHKMIYTAGALRTIVVTDSDVTYKDKELPSNYTFTYKFADAKPLLNITRAEAPAEVLNIQIPDLGNFTVPPRLVELASLPLTEGALFPVQSPYDEEWKKTTAGALLQYIADKLTNNYQGGGGIGHTHNNLDLLQLLSFVDEYLKVDGKKIKAGYADDIPDEINKLVTLLQGLKIKGDLTVGNFIAGLLGSGIRLSENGLAEMTGLTLREFLEVPEYRFNRVDVVAGELWNARAFGTIESVDVENQIATLHLIDGELRDVHLQDFCRGLFHNLEGNATSSGKDSSGFDIMAGFSTSYFTPTELLEDGKSFRYALKPGTTVHPCASMKFAVYGNSIDTSRQASAYDTRTYKRYLKGVNTWEITTDNIAMQFGDCSGLVIDGVDLSGYSAYLNNIYITGVIKWLEDNIDKLKGKDAYIVELSSYYAIVNVNSQGQIDDSIYDLVNIVSGENYAYTGTSQIVQIKYKIQTKVQVTTQSAALDYVESNPGVGEYSLSVVATGCTWEKYGDYLTIKSISADFATLEITVNLEGKASILKTFQVKRVYDGQDANLPDWVQDWNNNKTLFGDTYVVSPTMFSGTKDVDGKLTGISMGRDCITINGIKHTGIFALVADKIVFQLDPITRFYSYQGSIATPPTVVNSSNLTDYGGVSIINHILTWNIDLKKTGFNVQMDSLNGGDINLSATINLPRETQYEGVEFNLINTSPGNVVVVNGYGYFDDTITGKVNRNTKMITFLTQYKFKCIVFTPPAKYQYSLVDGKAIEWVLINN